MAKRGREMSLSVEENRFEAVSRLGENTLQTVLQGNVELPSTAAPIERVIWVQGQPKLGSINSEQDRVYVRGVVDLAMVYVPEILEGEPAGLRRVEWPAALPFDFYVEVVGAEPTMNPEVEVHILLCEWELKSGQYALDLDLIVAATARVYQIREFTAISDANIGKSIKLLTDGVLLNPETPGFKLAVEKQVSGILDLPEEASPIRTILDLICDVQIEEREVRPGQVLLRGSASLDLLYEARDYAVARITFPQGLPFELRLEGEQVQPELVLEESLATCCGGYAVNEGQALRVELQLEGTVRCRKRKSIRVLTEISTPGDQVQTRKELLGLDNFVNEKEQQGAAQGLLEIGHRLPPIRELLRVRARPQLSDYHLEDDKLLLEGFFDLEIFYLAHSEEDIKPLFRGVFPEAVSFQQTMVLAGLEPGLQPKIELETIKVHPDLINRETVEVALTFRAAVSIREYLEVEAVVEAVQVEPAPEDPPTLTYLFVHKGDTVWKLACQYHTTEEAILRANPFLQDSPALLKPGDKIQIPRF